MKNRSERHKKEWFKKKVGTGIVSLTIAIMAMTGIAYADADIPGILHSWFNKKTESVMSNLDQSVRAETDKQKAILKEELQLRLEASSNYLDAYAKEQERIQIEAIEQYAAALIQSMNIDNEQDYQYIADQLQAIVNSAKQAMQSVSGSYVPTMPALVPTDESNESDTEAVDVGEGEGQEAMHPDLDSDVPPPPTFIPDEESNEPVVETVDVVVGEVYEEGEF